MKNRFKKRNIQQLQERLTGLSKGSTLLRYLAIVPFSDGSGKVGSSPSQEYSCGDNLLIKR